MLFGSTVYFILWAIIVGDLLSIPKMFSGMLKIKMQKQTQDDVLISEF